MAGSPQQKTTLPMLTISDAIARPLVCCVGWKEPYGDGGAP